MSDTSTLFNDLDIAYLETDDAGAITLANTLLCKRLGYTRAALLAMRFEELRDPEHAPYLDRVFEQIRQTRHAQHEVVFNLRMHDGVLIPYKGSIALQRDPSSGFRIMLYETGAAETTPQARRSTKRELEIGREIQAGFLPDVLPQVEGWEIAARFESAYEVAGDFYDAFTLSGGRRIALVLGDVTDKGVGAALFMALVRSLLRAFADQHYSLSWMDMLSSDAGAVGRRRALLSTGATALKNAIDLTSNYIAITHERLHMFATVFFGVLDPSSGDLMYINAGHEPPLLIGANGVKSQLEPTGPAIGLFPNMKFNIEQVTLERGDTLLVYTDGVSEARSASNQVYGVDRIHAIAQQRIASADALLGTLLDDLRRHMSGAIVFDDITLLALKQQMTGS
jgi:PAS domain S-box-containing protein